MENSYYKFTKDVLVIGAASVLTAVSGFLFIPVITKYLGPYDYGIWAQVQATISLSMGLVGLGLPYAMTRFLSGDASTKQIRDDFYSVLLVVFAVTLMVAVMILVLAGPVANTFFDGNIGVVQLTSLIILVWSLDWVFISLFRAFRQAVRYAIWIVADVYAQIGIIAFLVITGHGVQSIVVVVLAIKSVMLILLTISAISQIGWGIPRFLRIKEYLSFGLPTLPANLSAWVVYFSDRFVIAHFLGVASVGTYSVAYVIGSLPITVASIFGTILPPTLSRLYDQGKITELITLLRYSLKYSMTVAIPFVFGAAFLARPVLLLFSTPEIASQGTVVLAVEAVNSLVLVFGSILNHALVPVKKTRIIGLAWLVGAIINLGLNLVTVPLLGIVGAVIGTLIAYIVAEGIQLYRSFKEFKLFVDWLFLLKSVAASAVMSLIVWLLDPQGMVSTVFVVAIGVIVYGVTLMLLRGFDKKEIQFFLGLFGRRSNTSI